MKSVSIPAVIAGFVVELLAAVTLALPLILAGINGKASIHRHSPLVALLALIWIIIAFLAAHIAAGYALGKVGKAKKTGSVIALAAIIALFALLKGGLIAGLVQFPSAALLYFLGSRLAE